MFLLFVLKDCGIALKKVPVTPDADHLQWCSSNIEGSCFLQELNEKHLQPALQSGLWTRPNLRQSEQVCTRNITREAHTCTRGIFITRLRSVSNVLNNEWQTSYDYNFCVFYLETVLLIRLSVR